MRWTLTEVATGATWTMPINPDSMTSPLRQREFTTARGVGGRIKQVRVFQSAAQPVEWEWSGVIRTKAHYDALEEWIKKPGKVRVNDHLGRTFEVMLQTFEPEDRQPTHQTSWRLRYTMKALVLREVAA